MAKLWSLEQAQEAGGQVRSWLYNALDVTGTREIADVLLPRLDPQTARTYAFERALQAPAMAMSLRGVRVDTVARAEAAKELNKELTKDLKAIAKMPGVADTWDGLEKVTGKCKKSSRKDGKHTWEKGIADSPARICLSCGTSRFAPSPFNPNSSKQCFHLFYELHGLPIQKDKTGKPSTDDDCLERLGKKFPRVRPITDAIRDVRDKRKQLGFLKAKLTPANRFPSTFNVGAAWTGRFSSSKDPRGRGGNLQNVSERHRHIFVADPGYEMYYADLKQAESLDVAYESGDEEYIAAHKSGDVHTYVARLVWPELPWNGDIMKDKVIASSHYPEWDNKPGHDFRFQSKGIQHGSNYGLTPYGVAMRAKIPVKAAKDSQGRYFNAFPHIRAWQEYRKAQVMNSEPIVTPLGRRFRLFGRPWDEHTHNQGMAASPQSMVADVLDTGMWQVWYHCDPDLIQLLAQVHDALLGQFRKEHRNQAVEALYGYMQIPVEVTDIYGVTRLMEIPVEIAVGLNWGKAGPKNPHGLRSL